MLTHRLALFLAELVAQCLRCCAEEDSSKEAGQQQFSSATLEYCPASLRMFRHVDSFLKRPLAEQFPQLKVQQRLGTPPRLVLHGGGHSTTVRIDQWKEEHIAEYLQERVKPAAEQQ